jgi:hypothetical protein
MEAGSAFADISMDIWQRPWSHRERGDHNTGRVRDAAGTTSARESGCFENTATAYRRLLKIDGGATLRHGENAFSGRCGLAATRPPDRHNAEIGRGLAGFVLNAPLSSVICR